jgi:glycosyltransferase involved in cell wall biosynthesis
LFVLTPHIVHIFPAFAGGGPEVRTATIINNTSGSFRHTILSLNADLSGRSMLRDRDDVQLMPLDTNSIWSLSRLLRQLKPNLLMTYGWGGTDAIAAARLAGFSRVVHSEDGFLDDETFGQKRRRQVARTVLFRAVRALIVPSQTLCTLARSTWKVAERRLRYIPNGVDAVRYRPPETDSRRRAREELCLPQNAIVVGTVGALRPEKNQLRLLRAFAIAAQKHPEARLLIVGDGPLLEPMKNESHQRGIAERVIFTGRVTDPERHYEAMDIFGLSSDTEQMPLVVLEAMSCGLPVISTDVGDTRMMVAPTNRELIINPQNDAEYARSLSRLILDPALRAELGTANQKRCKTEYSLGRMLDTYRDLYNEYAA